ncbi:MAG: thioredoxin family protein [Anaerolineae bacterium]|nr:thioredoxin family protein [Anaerolineae bacterium]
MEVSILGTGCYDCLNLELLTAQVLKDLDLANVKLVCVNDPHQIRKFIPEDALPGLVINGRLVSSGRLPDRTEIQRWLSETVAVE